MKDNVIGMLVGFSLAMVLLLIPFLANAQDDIYPLPVEGVYSIRVQAPEEADVARLCIEKVVDPVWTELHCSDAGSGSIAVIEITLPITPGNDVELRAFAYDHSNNRSEPSPNAARIDFTPPGVPVFLSWPDFVDFDPCREIPASHDAPRCTIMGPQGLG